MFFITFRVKSLRSPVAMIFLFLTIRPRVCAFGAHACKKQLFHQETDIANHNLRRLLQTVLVEDCRGARINPMMLASTSFFSFCQLCFSVSSHFSPIVQLNIGCGTAYSGATQPISVEYATLTQTTFRSIQASQCYTTSTGCPLGPEPATMYYGQNKRFAVYRRITIPVPAAAVTEYVTTAMLPCV